MKCKHNNCHEIYKIEEMEKTFKKAAQGYEIRQDIRKREFQDNVIETFLVIGLIFVITIYVFTMSLWVLRSGGII